MEDNKNIVINDNGSSETEDKKMLNKFLTIKEVPEQDKKKMHFEKMLEVFRGAEERESTNIEELSDEEIDFISAAGSGWTGYEICPFCHKLIRSDLMGEHMLAAHKRP